MTCPSLPARLLVAALVALVPGPGARAAPDSSTLALGVGQQKILPIPGVTRVAIGDPEIADAKQVAGGRELLVTGVGEGRTSLLLWLASGRRISYAVAVRRLDPRDLMSEVRLLLGEREGVKLRAVGDHVLLEGETVSPEDDARVQQILQLFPQVNSFVRPSAAARRLAAERLNKALQRAGFPTVQATASGPSLLLEGTVESDEEKKRLELVVRALDERVENLVTLGLKRMVLVQVEFVEVSSGDNKSVGIKPPLQLVSSPDSGISVAVRAPLPGLDGGGTQRVGEVSAALHGLTDFSVGARFDNGVARVLSQPRLLCASGEKAEFTAGGEIPLLLATQNQFAVEWKKFGVVLHVTPTADRMGNISTAVDAEVSDVDRSLSVRANGFDVPGLRLRDVKTTVTVKDGETIVLSGLYNSTEDKEVSKVPLLGHLPVLGELFKSRNFIEHKTELAVFITPRVITPASEPAKTLFEEQHKRYDEAADTLGFSLFD